MRLRLWLVLALLTVVVAIGAAYTRPAGPWRRVTPEEFGRLEEHRLLGIALLENGQFAEAAPEFAAIRKARPGLGLGYLNGAVASLQPGGRGYGEAEGLAQRAGKLMPRSALPLVVLAHAYLAGGKSAEAEVALEEALHREPRSPMVLGAATRYLDRSSVDRRAELISRLSAVAPANLVVQLELLTSQVRQGDHREALQTLAAVRGLIAADDGVYRDRIAKLGAKLRAGERDALTEAQYLTNVLRSHSTFARDRRAVFVDLNDAADLALRRWDIPPPKLAEPPLPDGTVAWHELTGAGGGVQGLVSEGIVPLALGDLNPAFGSSPGRANGPAASAENRTMLGAPDLIAGGASAAQVASGPGGFVGKLVSPPEPVSLALADLNNDFGLDLYAVRDKGDELWWNARAGTQASPGSVAVLSGGAGLRKGSLPHTLYGAGTATAVDLDQDGDLDLLRTRASGGPAFHYLRNNGNRTFTELTRASGLSLAGPGARQAVSADFDGDGDPDIFLVRPETGCELYLNLRQDRFRLATREWNLPSVKGARCATIADPDRDGDWDIAVVGRGPHGSRLYRNEGRRFLAEPGSLPVPAGEALEWVEFVDFDNDTWMDLACAGSAGARLLRNDLGVWEESILALPGAARWVTATDYDQDRDFDLCVVDRNNRVRLMRNDGAHGRDSLRLELQGYVSSGSPQAINSYAIGSEVEVLTPWDRQKVLVTRPNTVLPLGRAGRAVAVRVNWTSGAMQNVVRPSTGDVVAAVQLVGVSCPFLYTWDGEGWRFLKDFNWRSPLGLLSARDRPIPHNLTTDWVLAPGESLKPAGSLYSLIATEELREISYFDQMRLLALDHPSGVEAFLDERFPMGPADPFRVYAVSNPRQVRSARDQTGKNLAPALGRLDNVFTPLPPGGFRGVRAPHDLVLDLGDVTDPRDVRLFLTGWLYPASNSQHIAVSQNPEILRSKSSCSFSLVARRW